MNVRNFLFPTETERSRGLRVIPRLTRCDLDRVRCQRGIISAQTHKRYAGYDPKFHPHSQHKGIRRWCNWQHSWVSLLNHALCRCLHASSLTPSSRVTGLKLVDVHYLVVVFILFPFRSLLLFFFSFLFLSSFLFCSFIHLSTICIHALTDMARTPISGYHLSAEMEL